MNKCVKCGHPGMVDPRGRCVSVYRDAGGSLVNCGCKCKFAPEGLSGDPVEEARELLVVMPLHFNESDTRLLTALCDEVEQLRRGEFICKQQLQSTGERIANEFCVGEFKSDQDAETWLAAAIDVALVKARSEALASAMEIANTCLQEHDHRPTAEERDEGLAPKPAVCIYETLEARSQVDHALDGIHNQRQTANRR